MVKIALCTVFLIGFFTILVVGCKSTDREEKVRLVVHGITPQSTAEKAGIREKDILITYNGIPVTTIKELNKLKDEVTSDSVEVSIERDGKEMVVRLPKGQMGVFLKELLPDITYRKDAVVIEGIPPLDWSTGKSNSFHASIEAIANYLGIEKDYTYLYGVSGAAFRLHFHKEWCPSSPDPTCGYNVGEEALKAFGLEYRSFFVPEDDTEGKEELKKEILASIDKKMPVIAIDLIGVPEWGIIAGYQVGGEELICQTYFNRREGYDIADKFPWAVYLIDGKKPMPSDIDNYKKSFSIVLENLSHSEYDEYLSGLAAFDRWIKRLESDNFEKMEEEKYREVSHANAWIYDRLAEDREYAVKYLKRIQGDFPKLKDSIGRLIKIYLMEVDILKPTEDVVMYQFNMKNREDWTPGMRKEAIKRLKKARGKEEEALSLWKKIVQEIKK
jgi:hypothetical protein